jgi:hypothetical protein
VKLTKKGKRYDAPRPGYKRKTIYIRGEVWEQFAKTARANGITCTAALESFLLDYCKQARGRHGSSD